MRRKGGNDRGSDRTQAPRKMKTVIDSRGYTQVSLFIEGRVVTCKVHSLVLETFVGPRPEGMEACHFPDSDPSNNKLQNLRWDTHSENVRDRFRHREGATNKTCTRCTKEKPIDYFYNDKRNSDGKQSECKKCHADVSMQTRDEDKKRTSNREYMRRKRIATTHPLA
ncbi:unnamed protein product [Sphagnum jensenii]